MKNIQQFIVILSLFIAFVANSQNISIVDKYGQLHVDGNYILGQKGDTVQLRGMSLFWSQWMGQYYNANCVKWLRDDWKCTVIRAAMGVESGGYLENPHDEIPKIKRVVDAAIKYGIYVIIDYHSHEAHKNPAAAKRFFVEMAKKYGNYPNVIYEIYNEPLQDISWTKDIKPYSEEIIKEIRKYDADNIIIVGTRQWSQLVDEAAQDRIIDTNLVYTLHYYAASHGQTLRDEAEAAMKKGIALFVSEFGTCDYSGNGKLDYEASNTWWEFLDKYKISWCNWSIADKNETASALQFGVSWGGNWKIDKLTPSGKFVRDEIIKKNSK